MRLLLAVAVLAGFAGDAFANGRAPGTSTINFRRGMESHVAAGMTFGIVYTSDNGATWTWACEDAIGYGGMYDPDYAFTSSGALFATTFDGLKVNRDGCTYERSPLIVTDGDCFDDDDADTDLDDCNAGFTCSAGPGGVTGGFGDNKCEKIKFISANTVGPTGIVYAAAADPADGRIYRSTDDGITFPTSSPQPGALGDWWQSIEVAPSDEDIVYLFGYRFAMNTKSFLLFKSTDGGLSYTALPGNLAKDIDLINATSLATGTGDSLTKAGEVMTLTDAAGLFLPAHVGRTLTIAASGTVGNDGRFTITGVLSSTQVTYTNASGVAGAFPGTWAVDGIATMPNSVIEIAGISRTNPDIIYVRVTLADNSISDAIYRSIDGGQSWAKLIELAGASSFVARASGQLVVGTQALGIHTAQETGNATLPAFTQLAPSIPCSAQGVCPTGQTCTEGTNLCELPHVGCLTENSAGEVWACTQNYGSATVPKDGFGIMKTTDLVNWTGLLAFQALIEPRSCGDGTVQKDRCDAELWCGLCAQLGCDPNRNCEVTGDGAPDGLIVDPPKKNCCQSGGDDIPGLLIICIAVSLVVLRRRPAA